ncbi:uncharacterized protein [Amphiura filiformis]|uniref:uncharacterized protein n=1 Tax=Amphiura filiformis TaxID=82378 RepID=UPI003B20F198
MSKNMSRSTVSKSRADKTKEKDKDRGGSTSVPVPPVNTDVVPGRFTESDWNVLLDKEDGEEYVIDVVGDIIDSAINVIYDNYIQKQLYPYTVMQARDAILQIIEWQFLARDEGEDRPQDDVTWQEEEEPMPCLPDAWAQGSVPRHPLPPVSPPVSEPDTEVTQVSHQSEEPEEVLEVLEDLPSTVNETLTILDEEEQRPEEAETPKEESIPDSEPVKQPSKPRRVKFKPYRGPLKSAGLRNMNKTLDELEREMEKKKKETQEEMQQKTDGFFEHLPSSCHSILKVQSGRPPGSKDVTYDDKGNVVSVVRLDPEKLPSHRVRTRFTVVDPAVEEAHARLIAMRTGKFFSNGQITQRMQGKSSTSMTRSAIPGDAAESVKAGSVKGGPATPSARTMVSHTTITTHHRNDAMAGGITPLPPPLIESMELSPGVVVKEGNRIKRGPKLQLRHSDVTSAKLRSLKPLGADINEVKLTVSEIITSQSPLLRSMQSPDPIPPIVPRPPREHMVM